MNGLTCQLDLLKDLLTDNGTLQRLNWSYWLQLKRLMKNIFRSFTFYLDDLRYLKWIRLSEFVVLRCLGEYVLYYWYHQSSGHAWAMWTSLSKTRFKYEKQRRHLVAKIKFQFFFCWIPEPTPQLHNRIWEVLLPSQKSIFRHFHPYVSRMTLQHLDILGTLMFQKKSIFWTVFIFRSFRWRKNIPSLTWS